MTLASRGGYLVIRACTAFFVGWGGGPMNCVSYRAIIIAFKGWRLFSLFYYSILVTYLFSLNFYFLFLSGRYYLLVLEPNEFFFSGIEVWCTCKIKFDLGMGKQYYALSIKFIFLTCPFVGWRIMLHLWPWLELRTKDLKWVIEKSTLLVHLQKQHHGPPIHPCLTYSLWLP